LIATMMNEQCKKKDKNTFWLITFVAHFTFLGHSIQNDRFDHPTYPSRQAPNVIGWQMKHMSPRSDKSHAGRNKRFNRLACVADKRTLRISLLKIFIRSLKLSPITLV
jgi:hypothetical protein